MQIRTDLALEQREMHRDLPDGVACTETTEGDALITEITVENEQGARSLGKPVGKYITIEVPAFSDHVQNDALLTTVSGRLNELLPPEGTVLIIGLGNRDITPDALGPQAASGILATRHIGAELARAAGLTGIRSVAVLSPGVLGQTGIEAFHLIRGVVREIKPCAVVAIDALASRYLKRLGCTVQMSDAGIEPGAGVGNARLEISEKTLGVKVIAVGVPTVVDAATLVGDLTGGNGEIAEPQGRQMIVTPREIDLLIERAAKLLADSINLALHPKVDRELMTEMLS